MQPVDHIFGLICSVYHIQKEIPTSSLSFMEYLCLSSVHEATIFVFQGSQIPGMNRPPITSVGPNMPGTPGSGITGSMGPSPPQFPGDSQFGLSQGQSPTNLAMLSPGAGSGAQGGPGSAQHSPTHHQVLAAQQQQQTRMMQARQMAMQGRWTCYRLA